MSDTSFTLLEVHLGDGDIQIGPFGLDVAPGEQAEAAGAVGKAETDTGDAAGDTDGDGGGRCGCCSAKSVAGVLLAVGLLAAVAVAGAKLLGGDDEVPSGIAGDS